jgi:hypothetical protein
MQFFYFEPQTIANIQIPKITLGIYNIKLTV